jgi:PST family polysaccharide transporter
MAPVNDSACHGLPFIIRMKREVLTNALWGTLDRYSRLLLGVVSTAVIARYLGPQYFGALGIAISYAALVSGMANLGLDAMAVRWMTDPAREPRATLSAIVSIRIVAAAFWLLLLVVYLHAVTPLSSDMRTATVFLSAAVLFNALESFEIVFFTDGSTRVVASARTSAAMAGFVMKIAVVFLRLDLLWLIAVMFLEAGLTAGAVLFVFQKHFGERFRIAWPNLRLMRHLTRNAAPFLISNTLVILNLQVGKLLLYNTLGPREFGIYYAANRLVEVLYIIPVAFGNAFFSRLAPAPKAVGRGPGPYDMLYSLMSCIAVAAIVGGLVFGKPFLFLLYGSRFADAYGVFCILVFSTLFIFHVSIRTKQLINEGSQGLILSFTVLTLLVNALSTYFFSVIWGLKGAATAFVLAWMCNSLVFPAFMGKTDLVIPFLGSLRTSRLRDLYRLTARA